VTTTDTTAALGTSAGENRRFFAVTGMHRSHTSLLGRMLVDGGLRFHDKLVSADSTNPHGHYEDIDLLRLQRAILADNGAKWFRGVARPLHISTARRREARTIVLERYAQLGPAWGFKVPDTSLLLDFWAEWREARFLLIFRDPTSVLSSMYRRMGSQFYYRPDAILAMARSYAVYNERILAHRSSHPDRTFLVDSRDLMSRPEAVLKAAADKLQMPLSLPSRESSLIDREIVSARAQFLEWPISQLLGKGRRLQRVYAELVDLCDSAVVL
jgi:hypothetical protein